MPLAQDVDLAHIGSITHGFVGADLEALCREAAMMRLRNIFPEINFALTEIPYEQISRLEVQMSDFLSALCEVEPSAIREVFVEVPEVRWADIGGLGEIKARLQESVEWPLKYPELFKEAGVKPAKGILLSGPPGCGKTLLAKAIANETQVNFISVKGAALLSKYVGESERAVREVFHKARQAAPCIVFFDEIEALIPARGGSGTDSHVSERVLSQFLSELDGIEELKGVLILGATNRPDMIDPAMLRPGRFDLVLEAPLPEEAARRDIFAVHFRNKPVGSGLDLEELAREVEGFSGADIESVCNQAALNAVRRAIRSAGQTETVSLLVDIADIRYALEQIRSSKGRFDV